MSDGSGMPSGTPVYLATGLLRRDNLIGAVSGLVIGATREEAVENARESVAAGSSVDIVTLNCDLLYDGHAAAEPFTPIIQYLLAEGARHADHQS